MSKLRLVKKSNIKISLGFNTSDFPDRMSQRYQPIIKAEILTNAKRIRNDNWWHFYVLFPLAVIGNIISYALALALFGLLIYLSRSFLNGNQILAILYGITGFYLLILSHILYVPIYNKLPSTYKWKDVN